MLTPRENPLYRRLRRGLNTRRCIRQDSEPNTLPAELFRPHPSDFKTDTSVAALPDAGVYRVGAVTGRPGVSMP